MKYLNTLTLLILILSNLAFGVETKKSDFDKAMSEASTGLKKYFSESVLKNKIAPDQNIELFDIFLNDLYRGGFISLSQHEQIRRSFLTLSIDKKKGLLDALSKYNNFIDTTIKNIKKNRPACLTEKKLAIGGQCCGKLEALPNTVFELNNPSCGIKAGSSCSKHSECCSKFCEGVGENKPGVCAGVNTCFTLVAFEDECGPENPYCDQSVKGLKEGESVKCTPVNHNASNANSCISTASSKSCSSNDDCCSDKCSKGKCVEKSICLICATEGESPSGIKDCCPGLYKSTTTNKCMRLLPLFSFPKLTMNKKSPFDKVVNIFLNTLFPKAYAEGEVTRGEIVCTGDQCTETDGDGLFSKSEEDEFKEQLANCAQFSDDQQVIQQCVDRVNKDRQDKLGNDSKTKNSQKTFSQRDYIKIHQIPAFTAREKSDVKACEFNSFKDNWLAAPPTEKDAQVVLLGFEVIMSGIGTQDKINIVVNGKVTNIYSGLKSVMTNMRQSRMEMYKKLSELDRKMGCLCMETFGVNTFSSEKIEAYRNNCENGKNVEELDGNRTSNTRNQIKDVDQGVSGISQEKMILEWQRNRVDTQLEFLKTNASQEKQLEDLIKAYSDINWFEANLERRDAYSFKESRATGWVAVVVVVALFVGSVFTAVGGLVAAIIVIVGGLIAGAVSDDEMTIVGVLGGHLIDEVFLEDHLKEDVKFDKCTKFEGVFIEDRTCTRYVNVAHYLDKNTNGNNTCDVMRRRLHCVSSFHFPVLDSAIANNQDAVDQFESIQGSQLLDIWIPNFYGSKNDSQKIVSDQQIINKYNNSFNRGFDTFKRKKQKGIKDLKENVLAEIAKDMKFLIGSNGKFKDEFVWTQDRIDKLKQAVVTYATCDKFSECGEMLVDEDKKDELVGFGHFFQTETDAQVFANYVYQMHFFWPKVANTTFKAYPPAGLQAYLDGVLQSLQIMGSINALNALKFADLFNAFEGDLEARLGRYGAKGITADLGEISRNAKFSKALLKSLKLIDFSTGDGIEAFDKAIDKEKSGGNLKEADLGVVAAARSHAASLRRRVQQTKDIEAALSKTSRGKKQLEKLKSFAQKFSSPSSKIFSSLSSSNKSLANTPSKDEKTKRSEFKPFDFKFNNGINVPNVNQGFTYSSKNNQPLSPSHGLTDSEVASMIDAAKSNKDLYSVDPMDTIFNVVSKCYKRNLDLVLVSTKEFEEKINNQKKEVEVKDDGGISNEKKDKLKSLLEK